MTTGRCIVHAFCSIRTFPLKISISPIFTNGWDQQTGPSKKLTNKGSLKGIRTSLNQLLPHSCGLALTYQFWKTRFLSSNNQDKRSDHLGTAGLKYVAPFVFFAGIKETYRYTEFKDETLRPETIFITDIELCYELPQKQAIITIRVDNIFDASFNWISSFSIFEKKPEREWVLRVECRI